MLSPIIILVHITRHNTGANSLKTCPQVLHDVFLCAGPVAVHHCAASPTPKGVLGVLRLATATAVPALYAGVHARGNAGYSWRLSLIKRRLSFPTTATTAHRSAALCSLLGSLLRGALRGKLLALGLVAPIPVSALAHGATVAHAQAPGAYLLCALLTPWTRALHERMSGGALLRAVLFSPSLREMAFFFLTEGNPPWSKSHSAGTRARGKCALRVAQGVSPP